MDEVSAATVLPGRRGKPGLTLAVLGLAAMAFSVLQSLVIPVLPDIGRNLHVSEQAVTWVLTGYLLSASVATPILGRLGDMFGKRRILVITMAALAAGTIVAGVATSCWRSCWRAGSRRVWAARCSRSPSRSSGTSCPRSGSPG